MKSISINLPVVLNANIIDWEKVAYEILEDDSLSDEDVLTISRQMKGAAEILEDSLDE